MATAVGLSFQLTASAVGMTKGLGDASNQLARLGVSAQKAASDLGVLKTLEIGKTFISSVQSLGTTFAGYVSGISQSVEATSNLARELGVSYEQLTQLQLAAQLSGVSADQLAKAFTRAQVTITKAAAGGKEAVQALSAIGLSAADFQGLSSSEQFTLIANAINGITDPAQRAAAAVSIFGRSGAELLPVFRELGDNLQQSQELLAKFNGGVSEDQAAKVNAIGDAFDKVGAAINIVSTQALAALQPVLTQTADQFINFLSSLDITAVAQTAATVLGTIGDALSLMYSAAVLVSPIFGVIADAIAFIADNSRGAAIGIGLAAGALTAYNIAAVAGTITTAAFGTAIRALLASTGIGALVVLLGLAAGAVIEWALVSDEASKTASGAVAGTSDATKTAINEARNLAQGTSAAIKESFAATEDESKRAAEAAKKAADAARREADAAIQRVTVEQQYGGDSQRYAAAQAVQAIQADIKRTEEEIAAARASGDQAAIDAGTRRLAQLDQAMARERDIASGARKATEERLKIEAEYAKARQAFDEKRLAALAKPSTELLQLEDTRTASGYAALQRFGQDQSDDPAIQEYRKQLKELQAIRRELAGAENTQTVDIAGG